jgi:hypothetical protein
LTTHGSVIRQQFGSCTVTAISEITPHLSVVLKLLYMSKVVICIVTGHDSYSNGLVGLGLGIVEVLRSHNTLERTPLDE